MYDITVKINGYEYVGTIPGWKLKNFRALADYTPGKAFNYIKGDLDVHPEKPGMTEKSQRLLDELDSL